MTSLPSSRTAASTASASCKDDAGEKDSKKQKRRNVVTVRWHGQDLVVDEEDFGAFKRVAAISRQYDSFYLGVTEDDGRIFHLNIPSRVAIYHRFFHELPRLSALKRLDGSYCTIRSLPPSIGLLLNLEILKLGHCKLQDIPEEIGNLVNLKWLDLGDNPITSLPDSIGNLQNLEQLDLFATNIRKIPDVCWRLIKLRCFDINTHHKLRIPPMIERLENLESFSFNLDHNPAKEIANLQKLKYLRITVDGDDLLLPSFMENLKGLRCLCIDENRDLNYRQFEFVKKLPKLERFKIDFDGRSHCSEILLELLQENPSIVDVSDEMVRHLEWNLKEKVLYALSCNRYNRRSPFRRSAASPLLETLWPQLLGNADQLFDIETDELELEFELELELAHDDIFGTEKDIYHDIDRHDAVYTLLSDGQDHFVPMLLNRSSSYTTSS